MGEHPIFLKNIKKIYHHNTVLDIEEATFYLGHIYGITGTNGVGKTTLLRIIQRGIQPDEGEVNHKLYIEMVGHDNGLFQDMTVCENMFLNREETMSVVGLTFFKWKKIKEKAKEMLQEFGLDICPQAYVRELPLSTQKLLEVIMAISKEPDVLIIDEPLTLLDVEEIQFLNTLIQKYIKENRMVMYASHRLDEMFQIVHDVVIMRHGKIVGIQPIQNMTLESMFEFAEKDIHKYPKRPISLGEPLLEVKGLRTEYIHDISFQLRKGEILGVVGLRGAYKSMIGKALFGVLGYEGKIYVNGVEKKIRTTTQAVEAGVCYLGSRNEGMFIDESIMENIVSANIPQIRRLRYSGKKLISKYYMELLHISNAHIDYTMGKMSAGNKQKIVLAKWFFSQSRVFIFNKPTANIDSSSKVDIYNIFADLVETGAGIMLMSNDLEEVAGICDRVLVIENGRIKEEIQRKDLSVHALVKILQNWQ